MILTSDAGFAAGNPAAALGEEEAMAAVGGGPGKRAVSVRAVWAG